ncbi:MAG TPA: hypothetical protein VJ224_03265 [Thermoplasmata archaeon]|nr:hypothetical protein [Thermoplasmata archaeon]HLA47014.1 hypothetical protein [Thermoplasmata archaeon]
MATETARKPYVRHRSAMWWTKNPRYFLFQIRELSAVFVALYAFLVLYQLWVLRQGAESYRAFLDLWFSGPMVLLGLAILGFTVLHAVTWFLLTPKVLAARLARSPASSALVFVVMLAVWIAVSYVVVAFLYAPPAPVPPGGH